MRSRSKRALAIIEKLQKSNIVMAKELKINLNKAEDPLLKIVHLAKSVKAKIITKDFNLYKKASLYGATVLNINDLESALYPLFLPGKKVYVHLVKEGSQHYQAIDYVDDTTMVVAEDGKKFIG